MGLIINYGEGGGGLQNGKITGPKLFAPPPPPPSRQGKTFHVPPFKERKLFAPPPLIWLKLFVGVKLHVPHLPFRSPPPPPARN